ncbi:hypothetical protein RD792_002674 [Penstemon davidsonii]|uniref:SWIM-type domain-containing protein n=1 Tax=Penstemon davidsonii TaxID=160366 RepID=A0ABR0DST1_9LAMI|nr:hypothetical protein RD792_002674 [Penstemon davidsonii]
MVLAMQYAASEMTNGSYLVRHFKKVDGERLVIWIPEEEHIHCSCKEFESTGTLCRHALRVMLFKNYFQLPDKYFMNRWRQESSLLGYNGQSNTKDEWYQEFNSLTGTLFSEAVLTKERSDFVHRELTNEITRLITQVRDMPPADEIMDVTLSPANVFFSFADTLFWEAEVVKFYLQSLLRRAENLLNLSPSTVIQVSDQRIIEKQPSVEYLLSVMPRFSDCGGLSSGQGSRALVLDKSDIVWTAKLAFTKPTLLNTSHNPCIDFQKHSFVIIKNEPIDEYVGYVLALYEDEQGQKIAYVRCYFHWDEMEYWYPDMELCSREVVITAHKHEVRAECIDGLTTVLTPNLFEKGLKVLPERLASQTFVCYRQYHEKEVKSFCMTVLRSFSTQPMLLLICHLCKNTEVPCKVAGKNIEQVSQDKPPSQVLPNVVSENIELLCQDSGMCGCWFRCKILQTKSKTIKVQYYDILDVDGPEKLENGFHHTVANPDELGLRNAGQLTVRPWPNRDFTESTFEVRDAVGAWQDDGWWEGVVIGYHTTAATSSLHVYFPDADKFSTLERKNLRASEDWFENKWIKVKSKPDIFSLLASAANPQPEVPPQPSSSKGADALKFKKHMIISFNEASGSEQIACAAVAQVYRVVAPCATTIQLAHAMCRYRAIALKRGDKLSAL